MSHPTLSIVVLSAGYAEASSTARLGTHIGDAAREALAQQGLTSARHHLELRRTAVDVAAALLGQPATSAVQQAITTTRAADALIVVTPTVNASFSGLLKSYLDLLPNDALRGVPTVLAATGGTQRHTLMVDQCLRPMLAYQRAVVLPSALFATADDWEGPRPRGDLANRIQRCAAELALWLRPIVS